MQVQNDDRFAATALRNSLHFCDRFLVLNNQSTDQTLLKIKAVANENPEAPLEIIELADAKDSHAVLEPYTGQNWWVFAVDGDEIYDPEGLLHLREKLLAGEHQDVWQLYGHVMHVTHWHPRKKRVRGYRSPPARSMTKLYNFSLLESWTDCPERLHGGKLLLKNNLVPETSRYVYFEHYGWSESPFRCLHMVFLRRSSKTPTFFYRYTPTDKQHFKTINQSASKKLKYRIYNQIRVIFKKTGKDRPYRQGPIVNCDATPFNIQAYK